MNASEFGCGAAHQLAITLAKAGWESEDITTLTQNVELCRRVLLVLEKNAEIIPKKTSEDVINEMLHDPVVRVSRTRPTYPQWMKKVHHRHLEETGPVGYDVAMIERWYHEGQTKGSKIKAGEVHAYLEKHGMLQTCLRLRDLEAIKERGVRFFRKHFRNYGVLAWGGVIRNEKGAYFVPCLFEKLSAPDIVWVNFDSLLDGFNPTLRFKNEFGD